MLSKYRLEHSACDVSKSIDRTVDKVRSRRIPIGPYDVLESTYDEKSLGKGAGAISVGCQTLKLNISSLSSDEGRRKVNKSICSQLKINGGLGGTTGQVGFDLVNENHPERSGMKAALDLVNAKEANTARV